MLMIFFSNKVTNALLGHLLPAASAAAESVLHTYLVRLPSAALLEAKRQTFGIPFDVCGVLYFLEGSVQVFKRSPLGPLVLFSFFAALQFRNMLHLEIEF